MRARLREIAEAAQTDPKQALLDSVGDIFGFEPFHNLVLVAGYIAPEITPGGIIRPERNLAEDRFQGKIGLVLKVGPLAFRDDASAKFGGIRIEPGDWVIYRPADTFEMFFAHQANVNDGTPCRMIEDSLIKGRIADPALIY